jgi:ATP-binding cassette subfamily F protein 3
VESVLEVRSPRINKYRGNYDDYLVERAAREAQQWAAYKNQQAEIDRLQTFADRFRAKASKASQAQSKLKQIERMEKIEAPESATKKIHIKFPQPVRSGQRVISLKDVSHAYGELVVYKKLEIEVERDGRIVLVGPNGAGKSTLLKLLGGVLPVQTGERLEGHNTQVGYYSQNRIDMLGANRTVLEEVMSIPKPMPEVQARTVLGSFLFSGDDSYKKVSVLSGGEKSRLALIKLLLDPPNLLLMDEPTTHLDMNSIDALIEALKQYHGTLVFISHDVYFIKALAKSVLHINAGKLTPYSGDYDYYLEKSGATSERAALVAGDRLTDSRPAEAVVRKNGASNGANGANGSPVKTKEQKRQEAEQRQALSDAKKKAKNKLEQIERFISQKEARQKELTSRLEDPAVYQKGGEVMQINRELDEVTNELERLNKSWEQASVDVEKFEGTVAEQVV